MEIDLLLGIPRGFKKQFESIDFDEDFKVSTTLKEGIKKYHDIYSSLVFVIENYLKHILDNESEVKFSLRFEVYEGTFWIEQLNQKERPSLDLVYMLCLKLNAPVVYYTDSGRQVLEEKDIPTRG